MNEPTLPQKLWLAKMLPELIVHFNHGPALNPYFFWKGKENVHLITSREWLWIVAEVERSCLRVLDYRKYFHQLCLLQGHNNETHIEDNFAVCAFATASQRTAALMKVMEEKK